MVGPPNNEKNQFLAPPLVAAPSYMEEARWGDGGSMLVMLIFREIEHH